MALAALILAAGYSSRMGDFKPLLPLGQGMVLSQAVSTFQDLDRVIVVSGYQGEEVRAQAGALGVSVAHNPDFAKGMFSSVQTGVRALPEGIDAFFVLPVDIPLVRPATVRLLIEDRREQGADVTYPLFMGLRGHPPLVDARLIPAILGHPGEGGLRAVLAGQGVLAREVAVADSGVGFDLDTQQDYQQALRRAQQPGIPSQAEVEALWDIAGTPDNTRRHCRAVAAVAKALAKALNRARQEPPVNEALVEAAALLHDVGKGHRRHEEHGGRLVRQYGFPMLEDSIASHRDLELAPGEKLSERVLVFLADKFVSGSEVVPLRKRYDEKIRQWAHDPQVRLAIEGRLARAELVLARYEFLIGASAHELALEARQ